VLQLMLQLLQHGILLLLFHGQQLHLPLSRLQVLFCRLQLLIIHLQLSPHLLQCLPHRLLGVRLILHLLRRPCGKLKLPSMLHPAVVKVAAAFPFQVLETN